MKSNALFATKDYMQKHVNLIVAFVSSAAIVVALSIGFAQYASAASYAPITGYASLGSTGTNVSNIQTYLASDASIYPQGLVTGYYGSLTVQAVKNFQVRYGIVSSGTAATTGFGRVGPSTMAQMNALINGGVSTGDTSAPYISALTVSTSTNGVNISFNTNELATSRVYYSTSPIQFYEGDENSRGFAVTSGQSASYDSMTRLNHGASISGLSSNTFYYYLVVVTDPNSFILKVYRQLAFSCTGERQLSFSDSVGNDILLLITYQKLCI